MKDVIILLLTVSLVLMSVKYHISVIRYTAQSAYIQGLSQQSPGI